MSLSALLGLKDLRLTDEANQLTKKLIAAEEARTALLREAKAKDELVHARTAERDQVDDGWNALQEPVRAFLATLACKGEAVRAG